MPYVKTLKQQGLFEEIRSEKPNLKSFDKTQGGLHMSFLACGEFSIYTPWELT